MLGSMRKALKKGLLHVVVWITFIAMVLTYSLPDLINLFQRIFGINNYVISVDSSGITREQFSQREGEARQHIEMLKQQFGPYAKMLLEMNGMNMDPQSLALNEVSNELLLNIVVNKYKININDRFIKQALIQQLPKEMVDENGNINEQELSRLLKNMSLADFEKKLEESLKRSVALELINGGVFVPEFLIESKYKDLYSSKKYAILNFPIKKYLEAAKKTKVSPEELKDFFHKNKDSYTIPEQRNATVWKFTLENYGTQISKKDIENFYNKNKSQYQEEPAQVHIKRILLKFAGRNPSELRQKATEIKTELVQDPSKFSQLAKQYSDDTESAQKDGDVGFVSKEKIDPALGEAIFALEKDGQISDIIRTEEGLEIVQRVARKTPKYKPLSSVESEIKKDLESKKFSSLFNLEAKKIVHEAKKDISALKDFAQSKKGDMQEISFKKNDGSMLSPKIFKLNVGSLGFHINGNTAYIFKVDKAEDPHLQKFDSIEKKVEEDFYKEKAKDLLKKSIEKAKSSNKSFKDLGEEFGATSTLTAPINTDSKLELEKFQKQGVPLDEFLNIQKNSEPKELFASDGTGFLVKVDEVQGVATDFAKKKALEKDLYLGMRNNVERGFIASLAKNAKIKVNINEIKKSKRLS